MWPFKQKSDAGLYYLINADYSEKHTERYVEALRSDFGGEYLEYGLPSHFEQSRIENEFTVAYSP